MAIFATLSIFTSFARDVKVYPGTTGFAMNSSVVEKNGNVISNGSYGWSAVGLPIVKDVMDKKIGWIVLKVVDRHPDLNISAQYWAKRYGYRHSSYWMSPFKSSSGADTVHQSISFDGRSCPMYDRYTSYYTQVLLPPKFLGRKSQVHQYYIAEDI